MQFLRKKIFIFLLFFILAVIVIFLNSQKLLGFSNSFLNLFVPSVSRPVWQVSGSVSRFFSSAFNLKYIYFENTDLKDKNQKLLSENSYLKNLIKEKNILEKAKNLQIQNNFEWQIGRIIGMDMQNWSGYVIVDVGEDSGIKVDFPVITENKLLIGKVVEVDKNSAKISTIFNPSLKIAVKTEDSESFGVLSGDYAKNLIIDLVSKSKELIQDEVILTSGKDGVFPEGLLVGRLKSFNISPEKLFQTAYVKTELDIYDLDRVLIITEF